MGDGNNYAHWLLWSHGGKVVDENGVVSINSPETLAALNYAKELYKTFIPGTESWLDINNNRAFLAGQVSLTANGVSLYYAAKKDEKLKDLVADLRTVNFPIGPVGKSVELHQTTQAIVFKHTLCSYTSCCCTKNHNRFFFHFIILSISKKIFYQYPITY